MPATDQAGPATGPAVDGQPAWFNQTLYLNRGPPSDENYTQWEAAAAYDPATSQVVVFGGCSSTCPSNQTWAWDGTTWTNETPELPVTPPAVYGNSMVWDPSYHAILLVGGVLADGKLSDTTWGLFSTSTGYVWINLTSSVGPYASGTGTAFASAAFDDSLQALVLVDGCALADCLDAWSNEWTLTSSGWASVGFGPGGLTAGAFVYGASMAYDRADQELVVFGGYSVVLGHTVDYTYALPANDTWTNLTPPSCSRWCSYPVDRYGGAMTWDGELQQVLLVGGYSDSVAGLLNDTWCFSAGAWSVPGATGNPAGPPPTIYGAMPVNSSDLAPVLIGGKAAGGPSNASWVFEIAPQPEIQSVSPNPADAMASVTAFGVHEAGTGSGPVFFESTSADSARSSRAAFLGNFSTSFSYSTTVAFPAGTWNITFYEWDFFGVAGSARYALEVNSALSRSISIDSSPAELHEGVAPVSFGGTAGGGTPPYAYAWSFGDGSRASSENVTHDYRSAGDFTGWLNVTDSGGGSSNTTFDIVVYPQLNGTAKGNVTATEVGSPVRFTGTVAGGSGTYPEEVWQFGDGSPPAAGSGAVHTFAEAGTYRVYFNVTDSAGFTNSSLLNFAVYPSLVASSVASPSTTDAGVDVRFTGTVTGGPGSYSTELWQFGGGGPTETGPQCVHAFESAGNYTVYFNVTDALGFTQSIPIVVTVRPPLTGTAIASTASPHAGDTVTFSGAALNGTGFDSYRWEFGDGGTAPTATANHTYKAMGTYAVTLTITDSVGGQYVAHLTVTVSLSSVVLAALIGAAVVLVVGGTAGVLLLRRRRRPQYSPQPVPGDPTRIS